MQARSVQKPCRHPFWLSVIDVGPTRLGFCRLVPSAALSARHEPLSGMTVAGTPNLSERRHRALRGGLPEQCRARSAPGGIVKMCDQVRILHARIPHHMPARIPHGIRAQTLVPDPLAPPLLCLGVGDRVIGFHYPDIRGSVLCHVSSSWALWSSAPRPPACGGGHQAPSGFSRQTGQVSSADRRGAGYAQPPSLGTSSTTAGRAAASHRPPLPPP